MANKFVHLHVHTEYSLLDGLSKIPKLIARTKDRGMDSVAITDHGVMYGVIEFYQKCLEEGVKPIVGVEAYLARNSLEDKSPENETDHMTILATSFTGYQNLMKLVTIANVEGFYYKPRIDKKVLKKYSTDLIGLSGCWNGEVAKHVLAVDLKAAKKSIEDFVEIFGKENFYLEVQEHEYEKFLSAFEEGSVIYNELVESTRKNKVVNEGMIQLSKETGVPLVATNDVHYVDAEDAQAQDALLCIQTGKNLSDVSRLRMIDTPTYYLRTPDEMAELFKDIPEAVENTVKIAKRVNIEIPIGQSKFPKFNLPNGKTANEFLEERVREGIKVKISNITEEITKRLEYEIKVIEEKGYADYFLVVADMVTWAHEQGIISTTRGSAAGSLVSYSLGITSVNPIEYGLPFERFLNPYRPSLPDIDIDYADNRRDEVITYLKQKYGEEKVAQIGTFGTMMARAAARDVARVLGWPYAKSDRIAKMIPLGSQGFPMTIEEAKKVNPELGALYKEDAEVKELLDLAQKIEGNARHASVHAAGTVIGPDDLTNYTPLVKENRGNQIVTQYDMHAVESAGLVKMDILGIRNLSILGNAIVIVKQTRNIDIDLAKIPLDDKKAFEMIAQGETMGLFQLGGSGMTRYLKELKPSNIFDIMAMISLFRPGPMNSIPEFIERKHNRKKIQYFDPRMEEYLAPSYGLIVYQDDVLFTALNLAGYNWEEVDKFRKAMGKKIPAEMAKQKDKFISGAIEHGMDPKKADELFKLIEPFSAYGFNKAHAASYAIVAYQTAYMKANYPVEFMTAVMTAEADDGEKIALAVAECKKLKIEVLRPDVNKSQIGFAIEKSGGKDGIRFGLSAIKNVGVAAITSIIESRESGGDFASLNEFCQRVNLRTVNRKTLESLIKAGAMDGFGNRSSMLATLDEIKNSGQTLSSRVAEGQGSLFDEKELKKTTEVHDQQMMEKLSLIEEEKPALRMSWEKELLGLYLTSHPLSSLGPQLLKTIGVQVKDIKEASTGKNVTVGGVLSGLRKTMTKRANLEMAFGKIEDETGSIDVVFFPRVFADYKEIIQSDSVIVISGKMDEKEETPVILVDRVRTIDENTPVQQVDNTNGNSIEITIPSSADRTLLHHIYQILKENQGKNPTVLMLPGTDGMMRKIPIPFGADLTDTLRKQLTDLGCNVHQG